MNKIQLLLEKAEKEYGKAKRLNDTQRAERARYNLVVPVMQYGNDAQLMQASTLNQKIRLFIGY